MVERERVDAYLALLNDDARDIVPEGMEIQGLGIEKGILRYIMQRVVNLVDDPGEQSLAVARIVNAITRVVKVQQSLAGNTTDLDDLLDRVLGDMGLVE